MHTKPDRPTRGRAVSEGAPRKRVAFASVPLMQRGHEVALGIAEYARQANWVLFTYANLRGVDSLSMVRRMRCDGVITGLQRHDPLAAWRRLGIPIVNYTATDSNLGFPQVVSDSAAIGRVAAEHFLERGFRRLAFFGWRGPWWGAERWRGFSEAARAAGVEVGCMWVERQYPRAARPGQLSAWERWLVGLARPVGLMAASDDLACLVSESCSRHGIAVPHEMAVVGVNNEPLMCEFADPPLSSVPQNSRRTGFEAAALLDRLMSGAPTPSGPMLIPPAELVVRRSSDIRAVEDSVVIMALDVIAARAGKLIGVDEVVTRVGVGRRSLERRFRQALGRTVADEIRSAHVKRAQRLLSETKLPIAQIAVQAGFRNAAVFSVAFRRIVGMTASRWRKRARTS